MRITAQVKKEGSTVASEGESNSDRGAGKAGVNVGWPVSPASCTGRVCIGLLRLPSLPSLVVGPRLGFK